MEGEVRQAVSIEPVGGKRSRKIRRRKGEVGKTRVSRANRRREEEESSMARSLVPIGFPTP